MSLVQGLWELVWRARVILNRARHTRWGFLYKIVRATATGGATTEIVPSTVHFRVPKNRILRKAKDDFRDVSHAHFWRQKGKQRNLELEKTSYEFSVCAIGCTGWSVMLRLAMVAHATARLRIVRSLRLVMVTNQCVSSNQVEPCQKKISVCIYQSNKQVS